MLLFFTGAQIVLAGYVLKTLEDGHGVLMQQAMQQWGGTLPTGIRLEQIILGNLRADLPALQPDHRIGMWGIGMALIRAQTLPKYAHAMRQPWHHPTRHLDQVQWAFYRQVIHSLQTSSGEDAAERLGGALHTLQDSYTVGHAEREDNSDPFSPLVRLHYSPSRSHPFISPRDRVWAEATQTHLTPEAQAAVHATATFLALWSELWPSPEAISKAPISDFINRYLPIRGQAFPHGVSL
jgi:hypothetical protein